MISNETVKFWHKKKFRRMAGIIVS